MKKFLAHLLTWSILCSMLPITAHSSTLDSNPSEIYFQTSYSADAQIYRVAADAVSVTVSEKSPTQLPISNVYWVGNDTEYSDPVYILSQDTNPSIAHYYNITYKEEPTKTVELDLSTIQNLLDSYTLQNDTVLTWAFSNSFTSPTQNNAHSPFLYADHKLTFPADYNFADTKQTLVFRKSDFLYSTSQDTYVLLLELNPISIPVEPEPTPIGTNLSFRTSSQPNAQIYHIAADSVSLSLSKDSTLQMPIGGTYWIGNDATYTDPIFIFSQDTCPSVASYYNITYHKNKHSMVELDLSNVSSILSTYYLQNDTALTWSLDDSLSPTQNPTPSPFLYTDNKLTFPADYDFADTKQTLVFHKSNSPYSVSQDTYILLLELTGIPEENIGTEILFQVFPFTSAPTYKVYANNVSVSCKEELSVPMAVNGSYWIGNDTEYSDPIYILSKDANPTTASYYEITNMNTNTEFIELDLSGVCALLTDYTLQTPCIPTWTEDGSFTVSSPFLFANNKLLIDTKSNFPQNNYTLVFHKTNSMYPCNPTSKIYVLLLKLNQT